MGRKKIKLELIADDGARRTTFNKRKASLLKKASELSTLCGIDGCLIIYGPSDAGAHPAALWPSQAEARRLVERFRRLPAKKQGKNMMDQEDYAARNLSKLAKRLERERERNSRLKGECCLAGGNLGGKIARDLEELEGVGCVLDEKIRMINERIEVLKGNYYDQCVVSNG